MEFWSYIVELYCGVWRYLELYIYMIDMNTLYLRNK